MLRHKLPFASKTALCLLMLSWVYVRRLQHLRPIGCLHSRVLEYHIMGAMIGQYDKLGLHCIPAHLATTCCAMPRCDALRSIQYGIVLLDNAVLHSAPPKRVLRPAGT